MADHDIDALQARYDEAMAGRESSLDDIVSTMTALATSSAAPVGLGTTISTGRPDAVGASGAAQASSAPCSVAVADRAVWLDPADQSRCTDCGTCYQELPQIFEKTTVMIDGSAKVVARMIPGALDTLEITPEVQARIDRVRATCDAEIIQ